MVGGQESARSLLHLAELFRLADKARVLHDPELAAARMTQAARGARAWREPRSTIDRAEATKLNEHDQREEIHATHPDTGRGCRRSRSPAPASAQNYPWKPEKPITIIVPWAAGGSTDQVTRVAAAEIEKALGQKIVVVNQAGASGSIGTRNAMQAPADGYTWTAGAAKDLGTYVVSGLLDTKIADWRLYLNVANVSVLGVNPNTPYKTAQDVVDAMKAKPGQVSVATAGVNSSGHYGDRGVHPRARPDLQARLL